MNESNEPNLYAWLRAEAPNYSANSNLLFPYSDYPRDFKFSRHITAKQYEFDSVTLPTKQSKSQILDFWGEGRIIDHIGDKKLTKGFRDAYNVNHQFQLVSIAGPDKDKKIPNRIPTSDFINVSVGKYVPDSSFYTITLMGSPLTEPTSAEIARIINPEDSLVVIYGQTEESKYFDTLRLMLADKNLVLSPLFELSAPLNEVGPFKEGNLAFRPWPDVIQHAKKKFIDDEMDDCVAILLSLQKSSLAGDALQAFFSLDEIRNSYMVFSLGSKLWATEDGQKLMTDYMNKNVVIVVQCAMQTGKKVRIQSNFGTTAWLCVNHVVTDGNWQYAFFGTDKYIAASSTYSNGFAFTLEANFTKHTFRIQAQNGATSHLCVNGTVENSQRGFFGTDAYIANDLERQSKGQDFRFIPINGGEQFRIQAHYGNPSYLVTKQVETWEWAYFGTPAYIDEDSYRNGDLLQFVED